MLPVKNPRTVEIHRQTLNFADVARAKHENQHQRIEIACFIDNEISAQFSKIPRGWDMEDQEERSLTDDLEKG